MKTLKSISELLTVGVVVAGLAAIGRGAEPKGDAHGGTAEMPHAIFTNYQDFKWSKVLPDLGDDSPEICILHIDAKTQATKLMIRASKGIHIRKHWHSANAHSQLRQAFRDASHFEPMKAVG